VPQKNRATGRADQKSSDLIILRLLNTKKGSGEVATVSMEWKGPPEPTGEKFGNAGPGTGICLSAHLSVAKRSTGREPTNDGKVGDIT